MSKALSLPLDDRRDPIEKINVGVVGVVQARSRGLGSAAIGAGMRPRRLIPPCGLFLPPVASI